MGRTLVTGESSIARYHIFFLLHFALLGITYESIKLLKSGFAMSEGFPGCTKSVSNLLISTDVLNVLIQHLYK